MITHPADKKNLLQKFEAKDAYLHAINTYSDPDTVVSEFEADMAVETHF